MHFRSAFFSKFVTHVGACRFYCFAALARAPCCICFYHRLLASYHLGVHYTASREISSFPLFPASLAPPGRLRIELLKKITVRFGDVAIASRPASLSVVGRAQGALVSVYGAKAFADPLAALELLLQGRGPRPDLCLTRLADEFTAAVIFVVQQGIAVEALAAGLLLAVLAPVLPQVRRAVALTAASLTHQCCSLVLLVVSLLLGPLVFVESC